MFGGMLVYVSRHCQIKDKTLFLKIDLNAFYYRGQFYGHYEKTYIREYRVTDRSNSSQVARQTDYRSVYSFCT